MQAEKLDILQKCSTAIRDGKMDEAYIIMEKIPLAPHLAKALKDLIGSDVCACKQRYLGITQNSQ